MVSEGVEPALVENAAKLVGMPVGPLQLTDEISIDLGIKIAKATKAALGNDYPDDDVDAVIFALADQGRMGRKAKAGFYAYDAAGKREGLWPGLADRWPVAAVQPDLVTVQHRLLMSQVLEAVRAGRFPGSTSSERPRRSRSATGWRLSMASAMRPRPCCATLRPKARGFTTGSTDPADRRHKTA